ncbi:serine/threonine-protein kinase RsbW [Noviherbaspirillum humi]|uniref:Serine/threonine-protein kinase RsbW n=1 Tax=Noviherbaspirillum humi TaxID=1688639 RepID=A0A239DNA0_9BURK|nr:ATP-binding protein [Noviherbaspirillum humi]SNS33639.1 serine/threonine-protein kinase RsbW [Noviherbaspirillum humi]
MNADASSGAPGHAPRRASFSIAASLDDLSLVAQALKAFISRRVPAIDRDSIELAVVEAVTNVIKHGYPSGTAGVAEISYEEHEHGVTVEIHDRGRPIPASALEQADGSVFGFDPADTASLPESGMGLSLIKASFDEVHYKTENGLNRLILYKKC